MCSVDNQMCAIVYLRMCSVDNQMCAIVYLRATTLR